MFGQMVALRHQHAEGREEIAIWTIGTDEFEMKQEQEHGVSSELASARTDLLVALDRQTRHVRQLAGHNSHLPHAHKPCEADTQKSFEGQKRRRRR